MHSDANRCTQVHSEAMERPKDTVTRERRGAHGRERACRANTNETLKQRRGVIEVGGERRVEHALACCAGAVRARLRRGAERCANVRVERVEELRAGCIQDAIRRNQSCAQDACRMQSDAQSYALNVRVGRVEELRARGDQHRRQSAALSGTQRHFTAALTCASRTTGSLRLMPRISAFAESTSRCTVSETTEREVCAGTAPLLTRYAPVPSRRVTPPGVHHSSSTPHGGSEMLVYALAFVT